MAKNTTALDPVAILAHACSGVDRSRLDVVQTLLDAIYYLRTGRYPFNHDARKGVAGA